MPLLEPLPTELQFLESAVERSPAIVTPETPLLDAIALMSASYSRTLLSSDGIGEENSQTPSNYVLVMDGLRLVGLLRARDVVKLTALQMNFAGVTTKEVMTQPAITLEKSKLQGIFTVLGLFRQYQISHLPILNERGELLGVITSESIKQVLPTANFLKSRSVVEVMNPNVVCALATTSVLSLARLMTEQQVSCVVLVNEKSDRSRKALGIVTERDIVKFQALKLDMSETPVNKVMSTPLFSVKAEDSLWVAYQKMQHHHVRQLAVCDAQGRLLGLIAQSQIQESVDPAQMYKAIKQLQHSVRRLEAEKIALLTNRNAELEQLVQQRTAQLQEQAECDRLLATIAHRIRQSLNLAEILNATVFEVRQFLQTHRVIIYPMAVEANSVALVESVDPRWGSILDMALSNPCFAEVYKDGCIQAIEDIYRANLPPRELECLTQFHTRASLVVPILQNEQTTSNPLWGMLIAHHCGEPRSWEQSEIDLLNRLSTQVAIAIQQSSLFEQAQLELKERQQAEERVRCLNAELEQRVIERTQKLLDTNAQLEAEIDKRHQAEAYLQKGQEFLKAVLNNIEAGIVACDAAGNLTLFNKSTQKLFNLPHPIPPQNQWGEYYNFCLSDGKTPTNREEIPLFRALNGEYVHDVELTIVSPSHPTRTVLASGQPIVNLEGVKIGAVVAMQDITERKIAEAALKQSEERFRNLVEQTNDWVWEVDKNFVFTYVNPQVESLIGYSPEQIIGKTLFEFMSEDEAQRLSTILDYVTAEQEAFTHLEETLICQDGHTIVCETSGLPLFNNQGVFQGYRGIARDITERKRVERQIRKALTKEKELSELKSRFVTMASHEFRTPLTTILAAAESLEYYNKKWTEEKKITYLQRIQSTVKHMTDMLSDVLLLGKADAGKLALNTQPLLLEEFCQELVEEINLNQENKGRVKLITIGEPRSILVDEKILRHILTNLVSNAIKYSPGGEEVTFTVCFEKSGIIFKIEDRGIGIPLEDQKRLFEPFHRAKNVNTIPGTGLGLAIVKKSIEVHGGRITVQSEVGKGTVFTVTLP